VNFQEFLAALVENVENATILCRNKITPILDAPAPHQAQWLHAQADKWKAVDVDSSDE